MFKTTFAENIFRLRYAQGPNDSWPELARRVVDDVCGDRGGKASYPLMSVDDRKQLVKYIEDMKFIPGGRYLYYSGRPVSFWNNCFLLRPETDTREAWALLAYHATACLMSGGGIGADYSIIRPSGRLLNRTGGIASGPIPLMKMLNEIGRNVMQGGSRRSAIYASLNWQHDDIKEFITSKNWPEQIRDIKAQDFNFPAPLDMTNVSVSWDTKFIESCIMDYDSDKDGFNYGNPPELWYEVNKQMLKTGEPGHSFNFYENENEVLRNACSEITSEDDSDCCNLGAVNIGRIESVEELKDVLTLAGKFLINGTLRGELPYEKAYTVRAKNRRIGLGLMGVHEWLLKNNYKYEVNDELKKWMDVYKVYSELGANAQCDRFYINRPVKYRALAPTGTIGILASTTTGIEPLYAVAYKRRYLVGGTQWKYEYVIDATAEHLIKTYSLKPNAIETASTLASKYEARIKFQYEIQKYVDHAISSTINLPAWGEKHNTEDDVKKFSDTLLKYAHGLRGITVYPDGSRGGQPLTVVDYAYAKKRKGTVFDETEEKCRDGVCGL